MQWLIEYAFRLSSTVYRYGGDDPLAGFDCSGYVQELLMAAGVIKRGTPKMSSLMLFDYLTKQGSQNTFGAGAIAFFAPEFEIKKIHHVGFCIDTNYMLHAGSGDSTTLNVEKAVQQNAFVRMDLIRYRKDFLTVIKPNYLPPV